jgi:hypothetical protein
MCETNQKMFSTTFKELINSIKANNSTNSDYAHRIVEMNHTHGTIENAMDILHITGKGKHINTMKKFHICNLSKQNQCLNDDHTITKNLIFDTLMTQN